MSQITITEAGKMSHFDSSLLKGDLCQKKITWGSIVKRENWVTIAGPEEHLTQYFDDNNLWGYLSADPEYYSVAEVLAFMNSAVFDEEREMITCCIQGEEMQISKEEFARIFQLDYNMGFPLPETKVAESDLEEMLLEKADPAKDLSTYKGKIWGRSRTDFNHAYSNLSFVLMKDFEAKTGSFNCLSRVRLSLMYAVHTEEKVDWCTYIFRVWGNMINKFQVPGGGWYVFAKGECGCWAKDWLSAQN